MIKKLSVFMGIMILGTAGVGLPAKAGWSAGEAAKKLPRKILGIYQPDIKTRSEDEKKTLDHLPIEAELYSFFSPTHQYAEMPLNHLGMEVFHHDVEQPLPSVSSLNDYQGILVWFDESVPNLDENQFCRWLNKAHAAGLKIVYLGDPGFKMPPTGSCARLFNNLGVTLAKKESVDPFRSSIQEIKPAWVEFERKLHVREIKRAYRITPTDTAFTPLTLQVEEGSEETKMTPIVLNKSGAIAFHPFVNYRNTEVKPEQYRWRLNPFLFFETAFGLKKRPRPDTTTINGRRIYYSHIDGDGFFNISEVDKKSWSGEIFLDEILHRYTQLPFTVSLITGYYDLRAYSNRAALTLSQKVMDLPNVEPASHGYAHPLIWRQGTVAVNIPDYKFDPAKEITDSMGFINENILLNNRKTDLFLWTGDCVPQSREMKIIEKAGFRNMNGGDTRYDNFFQSYGYVKALGRWSKNHHQIYSSNSNENTYTNLWRGPFYGYRSVIDTFINTDSPMRVKPINVYIHFYSAEKIAALRVLKEVYDWVLTQPIFPLFASQYADLIENYSAMELFEINPDHYRLVGGSDIRTIRFDNEQRIPDLTHSKGVIGYNVLKENLYVFLDQQSEREIVLTDKKKPAVPYLLESDSFVDNWKNKNGTLEFLIHGWGTGTMRLAGFKSRQTYRLEERTRSQIVKTDLNGILEITVSPSRGEGAQLVYVSPML